MNTANTERAAFNPLIRPYLVMTIGFSLVITIIFLPLALIWFCGVGQWWARHYFDKLDCELTDKAIRFRKGILVQFEKTIPLENIQDVTFIEGPILRRFNLSVLKFETAGASQNAGANMELTGIIGAQEFRNRILAARDALKQRGLGHTSVDATATSHASAQSDAQLAVLKSIDAKLDIIIAGQQKTN